MSSDKNLNYVRALVDVVAIALISGADEQLNRLIKQNLKLIMDNPDLGISPESRELFAHFVAVLDGSSTDALLSKENVGPSSPDLQNSQGAHPYLRLLTGKEDE